MTTRTSAEHTSEAIGGLKTMVREIITTQGYHTDKLDIHSAKFNALDEKIDTLDEKIDTLDKKVDSIMDTLVAIVKRLP